MLDEKTILKSLEKVTDPEINISIVELKLIDKIKFENGNIEIKFHATTPFCPPMFAMKIAADIKETVSKVPGVKSVKLNMSGHFMSEHINKEINK